MTCYLAHISKASDKDQVMPCVVEAVRLRRAPLTTQFVDTLYHRGSELYLLELFSEFENAFLVIVVCNYKYLQSVFNCFNFMCF